MARIYIRRKEPGKGWRYRAVPKGGGRLPTVEPSTKFYVRYPDVSGKFVWSHAYDTLEEAREEAAGFEEHRGITAGRIPVETAIRRFLEDARKTKKRKTVIGYEHNLRQFQESLDKKPRFIDEVTKQTLSDFRDFLADKGYEARTQHNRLMTVLSLVKKNKIKTDFSLTADLPEFEEEPAVPYTDEELEKLFAAMSAEDSLRYKFFLGSGCRDKEVTFAAWQDIDFAKGLYHVRRKEDVGFTPKRHESRTVPLPKSLLTLLKERQKHPPHPRWIFVNEEGRPDNHFLRKLKRIALHAALNCGQCKTTVTKGRYERKYRVEVTCKTDPVCEHWYLHRFRKTCATRWQEHGIPVRTIQAWLGHKNLETTMIYLGVTDVDKLRGQIDKAFGD
ncbi:MAG TPA: tyrosine-type recombinase/integrase [Candidatus Acidoferrales bacterium]|nr:tyrosine-type recombinase/integrase [Candidatus Acidoferrales bacterium]